MTTTNDDSSSPLHRDDPAAVEAAKERLEEAMRPALDNEGIIEYADVRIILDALSARDEASDALRTLERAIPPEHLGVLHLWRMSARYVLCVGPGGDCGPDGAGGGYTLTEAIAALARQLPQEQQPTSSSSKEEGQG